MDGPAVFQVAEHCDIQVVQSSQLFMDGESIEKGLGRMLADAVSGVDDRLAAVFGGQRRRPHFGMA